MKREEKKDYFGKPPRMREGRKKRRKYFGWASFMREGGRKRRIFFGRIPTPDERWKEEREKKCGGGVEPPLLPQNILDNPFVSEERRCMVILL